MLRLSEKSPGPSWTVPESLSTVPVSFNIYSSTNPDMITVYYYPKDVTADPSGEDNFTSFKKQLVSFNVLKNGVKSIDYIDDEDDVIHIDSEQEFMEAIKFAKAYKEKNGQSVFLLIDEKSEQEVNSENAKVSTDDDKAELMEEESKVESETMKIIHEINNDLNAKVKTLKKKAKSSKTDDKFEPNTCCKNYLEQFKQEIITEVTKNVLKKLSSALSPSEINAELKKEESRKIDTPQASCSHGNASKTATCSPKKPAIKSLLTQTIEAQRPPPLCQMSHENKYGFTQNNVVDREYSIHKVPNYYHHRIHPGVHYDPKPADMSFLSGNMMRSYDPPVITYRCGPYPETLQEVDYLTRNKTPFGDDLTQAMVNDFDSRIPVVYPRHVSPPVIDDQRESAPTGTVEKKSSNDQKKKPKINYVVLKRDDLTQEQKNLVDQFKKMKPKKPNVLEMKSTIKKIAAPSPKKSSSSKIKNKTKIEKELILNAKKLSNLKLDCDEVQKTGGCKRKSHSTDENRAVKSCTFDDAMSFEKLEKQLKISLDRERQFRSDFLKNIRIFPKTSVVPVKNEEKDTVKDDVKETWSEEVNQSDGEINEKDEIIDEKVPDQDEQSTSDDVSTLSETSSLSEVSENNFELVYYDKETNDVGVKTNKRNSSIIDTKENSAIINSSDLVKQDSDSVKNELATEEGSKQSEEPKKEVRFDVIVEDIGPDHESDILIPELTKRPGGDYSYVRETLPQVEEITAETPETTEKNNKKETDYKQQSEWTPDHAKKTNSSSASSSSKPVINVKIITDKESQQNSPSHSATASSISSHCFVVHPSAPKPPKVEEKLKKAEKKCKDAEKKFKDTEKKLKATHEKLRSKTSRDDRSSTTFSNFPSSNMPDYAPYSTTTSCSYSNSAKNSPKHGLSYSYGPYVNITSHPLRPNMSNLAPGPMPPMYPPPPYPPSFSQTSSTTRGTPLGPNGPIHHSANLDHGYFPPPFEAYAPMVNSALDNILPFQSGSASTFDPMKTFHENIATEAAAQAYAQARKAVDHYFNKQQNERR